MSEERESKADAPEAGKVARPVGPPARDTADRGAEDGQGREWHWRELFLWLAGIVVAGALSLLGYCAQDFQTQLDDLRENQSQADSDIGQIQSGVNQLQADNVEVKADIRQMSSSMADMASDIAEMSSELAPAEAEASGMPQGTPPEVLPAETGPEPEAKYRGMAGIIGTEFVGMRMGCLDPQGDYPVYDPGKRIVAVGESLLEDFPCYSRVKVSRELEDGTTKTLEAIVADKFPDADPNWRFNLSQASAEALGMSGRASVTVELVQPPGAR
jgi:hypothetical protein